ncbi:FAS1-like dehydratase domain-containing protein [Stakelama tenebrarum]|uniref:Acyl dehydratase n=1 Tax=Stakelama tenebrarum TaxID=2711215 RepID=A0A6G6Y7B3_9SPHN|nr:MaoC family dehydratase N-terminal domain-containing protein [Sphingosinithalassobacter tenebrarum]QIG80832.1 acyl dehydratase [Sphingosinithalassobacter tenebrarum]
MSEADPVVKMDLSDVEPRVGKLVGGGQVRDPLTGSDLRRWVMAMDYANPVHWDPVFAEQTRFGGLIAPQSIVSCMDYGHGCQPACVGFIEGSHLIFGGEEWWYYGAQIRPGDRTLQERRFHDYKVTDTKFSGPTMFSRGDTIHRKQDGSLVAKERSTAIRYLASEAERLGMYDQMLGELKRWTAEEIAELDALRHAWILSNREGVSPRWEEVAVGDTLPRRVIGPHTKASFATEYRAFLFNTWGAYDWVAPEGVEDPWINQNPGWTPGFEFDEEGALIDPRKRDGLYLGPSRGHVDDEKAGKVGMSRAYGYGATMGAWCVDYLAYWAGWDGMVRWIKADFRGPAFEGDATYFDAEVVEKREETEWGMPLVRVKLTLANQDGMKLVTATADVQLPLA